MNCSECRRVFYSVQSLKDHSESKNHIQVNPPKGFNEILPLKERQAQNKKNLKLRKEFQKDEQKERDLLGEPGRPIKINGCFECYCGRFWKSSHAYLLIRQRCFNCRKKIFPSEDWITDKVRNKKHTSRSNVHHSVSNCERCEKLKRDCSK